MSKKTSDPILRKLVFNKLNGRCAYCGDELYSIFHIDHIIPKRRYKYPSEQERGTDKIENLYPSCASCNSCKSDLDLEDFRYRVANRVSRLNKDSIYTTAKRFGLVLETNKPVVFYFERPEVIENLFLQK